MWQLVNVQLDRQAEELVSSLLFSLGANGIVTLEEDPHSIKLGAYFDESARLENLECRIKAELKRFGLAAALLGVSITAFPDQDWMQKWREGLEPISIGTKLIIAPSQCATPNWKLLDQVEGRAVIRIDPGMAFGTGTHETTRLCLEAIEQYWRGSSLIDVGTGTGILAIAAAKLVPNSRVLAIDIDPQAVEVARENARINGVSIQVLEGQLRDLAGTLSNLNCAFDMVVANLTAEAIISSISDLARACNASGLLILSGILSQLATEVEQAISLAGLRIVERRELGEWVALVAQRGEA
jgi:ribosomal protein L11 methyltransferase